MNITFKTILLIFIVSPISWGQKQSWVNEPVPQRHNWIYFKAEGISDTNLNEAQGNAFLHLIDDVFFYKGVHISASVRTELIKITKDGKLTENEKEERAYRLTGEMVVKDMRKVNSNSYQEGNTYHYVYCYRLPVYSHVGAAAAIPLFGQLKRKQFPLASVLLACGIAGVWQGLAFNDEANRYNNLLPLYSTNPVNYRTIQDSESTNRTRSNISFGVAGLCYLVGTIEAFARNRKESNFNKSLSSFNPDKLELTPYTTSNHSGFSLIIHLN
jgi:hypothetical protein